MVNVVEVNRVSDRVMSLKLVIEGMVLNIVSAYAPQMGCNMEEKDLFWREVDEITEKVLKDENLVIGAA